MIDSEYDIRHDYLSLISELEWDKASSIIYLEHLINPTYFYKLLGWTILFLLLTAILTLAIFPTYFLPLSIIISPAIFLLSKNRLFSYNLWGIYSFTHLKFKIKNKIYQQLMHHIKEKKFLFSNKYNQKIILDYIHNFINKHPSLINRQFLHNFEQLKTYFIEDNIEKSMFTFIDIFLFMKKLNVFFNENEISEEKEKSIFEKYL